MSASAAGPFRVALTFDAEHPDRPTEPGVAEWLVGELARLDVTATFFIQGRWAEAYPGLAREVADAGHLIGSHSHHHARLPDLTGAGLEADIGVAEEVILETTGRDPKPWFRCPFGSGYDEPRILDALSHRGYVNIHWNVEPLDWEPDRVDVEERAVHGALQVGDGSIVLLHTWPLPMRRALPGLVGRLRDEGAQLVTIDRLPAFVRPASVPPERAQPVVPDP